MSQNLSRRQLLRAGLAGMCAGRAATWGWLVGRELAAA